MKVVIRNNRKIEEIGKTKRYYIYHNKTWLLHNENGMPAIITPWANEYYWYGIPITEKIAKKILALQDVLRIPNLEVRRAAMAIYMPDLAKVAKLIDTYTPDMFKQKFKDIPMYKLFELHEEDAGNPFTFLEMRDPSKQNAVYYIRTNPDDRTCKEAVAHSYGFQSWEEYISAQTWV